MKHVIEATDLTTGHITLWLCINWHTDPERPLLQGTPWGFGHSMDAFRVVDEGNLIHAVLCGIRPVQRARHTGHIPPVCLQIHAEAGTDRRLRSAGRGTHAHMHAATKRCGIAHRNGRVTALLTDARRNATITR